MHSIKPETRRRGLGRALSRIFRGLWLGCLLWVVPAQAIAQPRTVELAGHLGYQWGGLADETTKDEGVDSLAQALGVHGTGVFGLIFNYHITRTLHMELVWDQQPTQIDLIDREAGTTVKLTDMRVHYYHAGLVYNWSNSTKQPFVGMTVGMTRYEARGDFDSESGFSFGPVFGYKTWMSDRFGLRLHTRMLLTNLQAGELFTNPVSGFGYTHTKNTWSTQIQVGLALMLGM